MKNTFENKTPNIMKHLSIGIIFATLLATVFISCREGKQGEPGPSGTSSTLLPYKSGLITGVLKGSTRTKDSAFTLPLNFQYFKGTSDNDVSVFANYNEYRITRYDSTGNSYIKFEFSLNYIDPNQGVVNRNSSTSRTTAVLPHIYSTSVTIVSNRKLNPNNMFYFGTTKDLLNPFNVNPISLSDITSGSNSGITYSNIVVNSTTGAISFDYTLELSNYENSTNSIATMDGTVSATPYNLAYREGAE